MPAKCYLCCKPAKEPADIDRPALCKQCIADMFPAVCSGYDGNEWWKDTPHVTQGLQERDSEDFDLL